MAILPIERIARAILTREPRCKYCNEKLTAGQKDFCSDEHALEQSAY